MQPQQPPYESPPTPTPAHSQLPDQHPSYDFILNTAHAPKHGKLRGGTKLSRIAAILGSLFVLVILLIIVKGVVHGAGVIDVPAIAGVIEDQQEILHLLQNPAQNSTEQTLTTNVTNLVATGSLSIGSEQAQLIHYLKLNGTTFPVKDYNLKVSRQTDLQLTSSIAAATYETTFRQVMQNELNSYTQDLRIAYAHTTGPKGRALLSSDYNGARLLLKQLNSPLS